MKLQSLPLTSFVLWSCYFQISLSLSLSLPSFCRFPWVTHCGINAQSFDSSPPAIRSFLKRFWFYDLIQLNGRVEALKKISRTVRGWNVMQKSKKSSPRRYFRPRQWGVGQKMNLSVKAILEGDWTCSRNSSSRHHNEILIRNELLRKFQHIHSRE